MCLASGSRFCLLCLLLYSCHAQADDHDHGAIVSKTTEDMYDVADSMVEDSAEAEEFFMEKDFFLNKLMTKYGNGVEMSYEGFEHLLHHLGLGGLVEFDHDAECHKAENGTEFVELHIHHNHTDGSSRVLASKCANGDTHKHSHTHTHEHKHVDSSNNIHNQENHDDHEHHDHEHPDDHNHEHADDHNHEHTDDHNHEHTDDHNHEHTDDHNHEHTDDHNHEHTDDHNHEHTDDHNHEHTDDHNHEHTDDHEHSDHKHGNNTGIVHEHLHNETEHKKELGEVTDVKDDHKHLHEDDHEHLHEDDHAHHDHVHKRNADYDECLPANVMLRIVNQDQTTSISKEEFRDLCPSLIYQIDAGSCPGHKDAHGSHKDHDHFHGDHAHGDHDHVQRVESAKIDLSKIPPKVWGFSAIAVIIISLVGLLGVAVIPIMQKVFYNHMLQFLVALAVGALSGDALLHLLPHAIGGGHGSGDHGHGEESHQHDTSAIYKGLCGLLGIYFFFFIERVLTIFTEYKRRKKRSKNMKKYLKDKEMVAVGERLAHTECDDMLMSIHPNKALQGYADEAHKESCTISLDDTKAVSHEHGHRHNVHQKETNVDGEENQSMIASHNSNNSSPNGHGHGHGHSHGGDVVPGSVASVAWMVIMGDGIHNFSDGLAIGAAFANSITGGFSTSIAVFCHELPHEIGDFAMLLRAGMSAKQAVIYNCLSSILCFIGMLIGVAIGNLEGTSLWIFAAVGGMFLYIALVDMLPELMSVGTKKGEHPLTHLLLQCIGMMIGAGIMLVIAVYEEDLMTLLD